MIIRALDLYLNEDVERFGLAGLLRDIDLSLFPRHFLEGGEILARNNIDNGIIHAAIAHNGFHGIERESLLAFSRSGKRIRNCYCIY